MTRLPGRGSAVALSACALALATASAVAAPNPTANIPLGRLPAACRSAPRGSVCERASIVALDRARAKLGLGRYLVPSDFVTLAPARQWLILANLDRLDYSLRVIAGLNRTLDVIAKQGARHNADPNPWPLLKSLRTGGALGFGSNWGGGMPNALIAYYEWMYDDGYGGPNLDCARRSAPGCWGHRQVILSFPQGGAIAMGGAVVQGSSSYALTIVDTSVPVFRYDYTWLQAKADGAGRAHT
jgi:hypothetical protein